MAAKAAVAVAPGAGARVRGVTFVENPPPTLAAPRGAPPPAPTKPASAQERRDFNEKLVTPPTDDHEAQRQRLMIVLLAVSSLIVTLLITALLLVVFREAYHRGLFPTRPKIVANDNATTETGPPEHRIFIDNEQNRTADDDIQSPTYDEFDIEPTDLDMGCTIESGT
ncbi:hypothetical protein HPB50_004521 [Hyalomma asiaticum]|uniref:Uncharacterized protein n=1 Tax=Hyalomma asiaticum TaxID=266040 RepID=A0ACB7RU70_HYAAI|nr:hypothetical protein HPB50_004521 [Hyalomma asiaticum]